jgi:hypothetical protein
MYKVNVQSRLLTIPCGLVLLAITARPLNAQPQVSPQTVQALNNQLLQLHARTRTATDQNALLELRAIAAQRRQALQTLMSTDPAAMMAMALPDDVRNALPSAVRDSIEQHVRLHGEMEVAIEDGREGSRMHYGLVSGDKRLALHFADDPPENLLTGISVNIEGVQLGDAVALMSSGTTAAATATVSILPNTFGAQKTLVILVNFQDLATQPYSPSSAYDVTFTTVSNFYRNNSFQQTWLTGDVAGWYTIPVSSTTCSTSSIQTYAQSAAQNAGYVLSNYNHFIYAFPQLSACSFAGTSSLGGNPSYSWINGSYYLQVVAHEFGHQLGLYHSHSLSCGTAVYATSGCSASEYGDTLDVIGGSHYNDFTAAQKERLGWLNYGSQPPITTVSSSGTYPLAPYETQDTLPKALKIAVANGTYYLESRQAIGDDAGLTGNANVLGGILLHNYTAGSANSSYLLNATPGGSWTSPALSAGKSYTDSTAGVTIAPLSVTSTGASVQVTYGALPCTQTNPSISNVGPSNSVAPGSPANFAVTVRNNDSSGCSSSTYALTYATPSGWAAAYSAASVTLAPGASASTSLQVTAPSGTPNGTYTVASSANNSSKTTYTASASAAETVYTPPALTVAVSANQSIFTSGQKVSISVTVTSGTTTVSGASVTVQVTRFNGSMVTLTGTTGTNGIAVVTYQVKKNDPKGVWQVVASSGSSSANTSFTVQ